MKERPILFSGRMVRALLNGSKIQTRRPVKLPHQNPLGQWEPTTIGGPSGGHTASGDTIPAQGAIWHTRTGDTLLCPYGEPGDRLWARETFCPIYPQDPTYNNGQPIEYDYRASYQHGDRLGDRVGIKKHWKPSIHMPRAASRITLEITGVRVERLQDISEEDAHQEGVDNILCAEAVGKSPLKMGIATQCGFAYLWDEINGAGAWDANPWVWVLEFRRFPQ